MRFAVAFLAVTLLTPMSELHAQTAQSEPITRARRPKFERRDIDGIFFRNIFEEALVGPRPANLGSDASKTAAGTSPDSTGTTESAADANAAKANWSRLIAATAIEDEVKSIKIHLDKSVTTPTKFAGGGAKEVRQDYSMLAMLFAIISEYDADIRWQKNAADARDAFARCADAASTSSETAFRLAKNRRDDLGDILRGGAATLDPAEEPANDWSKICDRTPLMIRLKKSYGDVLKPGTSSASEFKKQRDEILHEAMLVAAMGKVIAAEGMEEAGEEEYVAYAVKMTEAALALQQAIELEDLEKAGKAVGQIDQACSRCHGDWQ